MFDLDLSIFCFLVLQLFGLLFPSNILFKPAPPFSFYDLYNLSTGLLQVPVSFVSQCQSIDGRLQEPFTIRATYSVKGWCEEAENR